MDCSWYKMIRMGNYDVFWEKLAEAMGKSDKPSLAQLMAQVSPALKNLIQGMLDADP